MNCKDILDIAYENDIGIFGYIQIRLHSFFCSDCAKKIELYNAARNIMQNDFFPPSPNLENKIMSQVAAETNAEEAGSLFGNFSVRGWVVAGLVIFVSFAAAFFGMDFRNIANETGTSFLLPIGILFGIVLTIYCSVFIGSHLKEFSERFGI